jgi:hypothetical protein
MFKITTSKQVMSLVVMGLALVVLIISHNYFQLNAKVELLNLSNNIKEKETLMLLEKFSTSTDSTSSVSGSSIICNRTPLSIPAPRIEEIANQFTGVKEDLRNAIYNNQLYESSLTAASMMS